MRIEMIRELEGMGAADWYDFVSCARHQHPRQSPRFAAVERAIGHGTRYIVGRAGSEVRAAALLSLRNRWPGGVGYSDAATLSGPVCDDIQDFEAFLAQFVELPEMRRIGRLHISPYWLNEEAQALKAVLDRLGWHSAEAEDFRHTGLVDLRQSGEDLLHDFSKSARREVRRAQRQGIEIRRITGAEAAGTFFASLNRLRARRGLRILSDANAHAQFHHAYSDPEVGVAFGAFHSEKFVGGLLIYRSKHTAHGRHFTMEPDILQQLSNLRIAPILWWSGMIWAKDQGCRWLDLEGYNANVAKADPNYNVHKYKGDFRPTPALRISEHYFVINRVLDAPVKTYLLARRIIRHGVGAS